MGDWDGDGVTTPGVVEQRPRTGSADWLLRNSNSSGAPDESFAYGLADDRPITGDWDGDGDDTPCVHRRPNRWFLSNDLTGGNADTEFTYGSRSMKPLVWR